MMVGQAGVGFASGLKVEVRARPILEVGSLERGGKLEAESPDELRYVFGRPLDLGEQDCGLWRALGPGGICDASWGRAGFRETYVRGGPIAMRLSGPRVPSPPTCRCAWSQDASIGGARGRPAVSDRSVLSISSTGRSDGRAQ